MIRINYKILCFTYIKESNKMNNLSKHKDKIKGIIGYSGKIISTNHLEKNISSRPHVFLMHGDDDQIVPVNFLLEAKDFFNKNNYEIETKIFKNCEHRIPTEGASLGLAFIKKNFTNNIFIT